MVLKYMVEFKCYAMYWEWFYFMFLSLYLPIHLLHCFVILCILMCVTFVHPLHAYVLDLNISLSIYLFFFSLSDSTFFLLSFHSSSLVLLACFLKGKTMKEKMYGRRKREFGVKEKEIRKSVERKIKLLRFIFQI